MILRLSSKLAAKAKVDLAELLPLDPDPLGDWSANLFKVGRSEMVLVVHTTALYAVIVPGRAVVDDGALPGDVVSSLEEALLADELGSLFPQDAKATLKLRLSKPLNRSVDASLSDRIARVKQWMERADVLPVVAAQHVNDTPSAKLEDRTPREMLAMLAAGRAT